VLFLPWLLVIARGLGQIQQGMAVINAVHTTPVGVVRAFLSALRVNVLDLDRPGSLANGVAALPIMALLAYAILDLRRRGPSTGRLMIWLMLLATTLPFLLPDLLWGGQRSATARYLIPCFAAMDVALASLLCAKLEPAASRAGFSWRPAWIAVAGLVMMTRLGSLVISSQADTWWSKEDLRAKDIAALVNRSPAPLLVSDNYLVWILSLAEYLDGDTGLALAPRCYLCARDGAPASGAAALLPAIDARLPGVRSVFTVGPSAPLLAAVRERLATLPQPPLSRCVDIRGSCPGDLSLW
jgi:hypothetical protein